MLLKNELYFCLLILSSVWRFGYEKNNGNYHIALSQWILNVIAQNDIINPVKFSMEGELAEVMSEKETVYENKGIV